MVIKRNKVFIKSLQGAVVSLMLISVAACNMSPEYKRPDASIARDWPIGPSYGPPLTQGAKLPQAYNVGWKVFFRDPVLSQLIAMSLSNNRNLREAIENITASHASYIRQRGEIFPTIDANAGASYQTSPGKTFGVGGARSVHSNSLSTGLGISNYEIDLFDHVRSLTRAARESYLAQQENTISVQISLISEVANTYMAWLADMDSLRTIQQSIQNRQSNLNLIKGMHRYGQQNAQAVAQAVELLQEAKSQEQVYLNTVANDMNSLTLLVGQPIPASVLQSVGPNPSLDQFVSMPEVASGLPSDLLERRPDIRQAEHLLKEANANIGYARAAFFPSIQLTTSGGTAGSTFAQMFGPYSAAWSVMPKITVPLLDEGQNLAQLRTAKAKARAAAAHYQYVVQTAFKEVADSLSARATLKEKWGADIENVKASQKDYQLSFARFKNGIDSYLSTLVAQRTLLTAKVSAIQSRLQYMQSLSTLYKTLGGGWSADTDYQSSAINTASTTSSIVKK
ncbi:efflux transporter outer membrane subunit [Commensalibacter oyaizuii]|uniref:Efflux transporter outer membrane subunit n=1 Tax=Commensalibacter oyaizuii TaxID=3043873 RepID=A0ABT6Q201_9PROT|nr:efflux transporter outer membrane subunit [Commensalibacter sp. TBRC 16381]MDI2091146.1 efflux transporter outer membrane subunit [Commensalibacter sp. TBRC 16381]